MPQSAFPFGLKFLFIARYGKPRDGPDTSQTSLLYSIIFLISIIPGLTSFPQNLFIVTKPSSIISSSSRYYSIAGITFFQVYLRPDLAADLMNGLNME